jgi:hypothetical protein
MYREIDTTDKTLTLDRAKSLTEHVLQPLSHVTGYGQEFYDFEHDLMQLVEAIEVYACFDLSAEEIADLHELNDEVTTKLDDLYQPIMEAYDEYLRENPDENPDNPKQS